MKRLFPILAAGIMASLSIMAGIGTVHAQEKAEVRFNGAVTPRRITMGVGKSVIIDLPQDAAEIFVADPKVANAVVRSPRKLYVIGMDPGQTSVFALDQQGRQIAALELSIGRDVGELQQILRAAMPAAAITARTVNDTIILTGAVDSIEDAQRASDIAKGFVQRLSAAGPPGAPGAQGRAGRDRGWQDRQCAHHTRPRSGDVEGHCRGSKPRYRQATRHHHKLADRQLGHLHPI